MTKTIHAFVSGRVQGVFYRASLAEKAQQLQLCGFVRNLPDGRVEYLVQGAADRVDALVQWSQQGPPFANVTDMTCREPDAEHTFSDFSIR